MPGSSLVYALLYLLIIGLIFWLLEKYCPEPPKSIVKMIMTIRIVIALIVWLIGLLPAGPGLFPYRHP